MICCFANNNEVLSALGPDGLPVYNTASSPTLLDINSKGELNWWDALQLVAPPTPWEVADRKPSHQRQTALATGSFYPPNGARS